MVQVAAQRPAAQGSAARDREFLADRGAGGRAGVALGHQLGAGLEDEGLDLARGHADRRGDLGLRHAAELEQDQRGALVLGQASEVGDQFAQVGAQGDAVGEPVERRLDVLDRDRSRPPRGQDRLAAVAGDRVQPGLHGLRELPGAQRPVGAQEGLLERVLAVLGVAQHVPAEREQRPVVPVVEDLEGGLVARADPRREARVVELIEAAGHLARSSLPEQGWRLLGISQATTCDTRPRAQPRGWSHAAKRANDRRRSPACRAGSRAPRSNPSGARETALRRPSDQSSTTHDVVPARAQRVDRVRRHPALDLDPPRLGLARIERAREVRRVEHRRVDRRLQVAPVHRVGEEELERPLVLLVAAGRAERQHRPVVAHRQRRRQRRPRPPPAHQRRRQPLLEPEHLRARAEAEAEPAIAGELCSQPPLGVADTRLPKRSATSRWQVSPRVGSPAPAAARTAARPHGRQPPAEPRAQLARGLVAHQRPPRRRVPGREQPLQRHRRRVPVPRLAVGERELRALEHRVDVVDAEERPELEPVEQRELLQEHRPLAPRPGLEHRPAAEVAARPAPRPSPRTPPDRRRSARPRAARPRRPSPERPPRPPSPRPRTRGTRRRGRRRSAPRASRRRDRASRS